MFMKGIYPGVEYNIINVKVGEKEVDDLSEYESGLRSFGQMASSEDDVVQLTVKPIYPLIPQLERRWPITVNLTEVPIVLSKGMYNTLTVLLSTSLAVSFFLACALLSQVFTFSVVNSRSMMPTIIPKDIILVEKVSPLIQRDVLRGNPSSDEVVFFREPTALAEYIEREKLPPIRKGDLLVKRVRSVQSSQCVEMRGDNPPVSLDSRQFGCISSDYIVGRPIIRVWPLNRVGVLGQLQTQTQTQTQTPRAPQ
jgi:signal peptidase I